jgi:hypothetical protein
MKGPLPLVVAVSGHRDIAPGTLDLLRTRVLEALRELAATHPHTPLVLLTALAPGADQLCAEVALELGLNLRLPLPLPQDIYLEQFVHPEDRARFLRLAAAGEVIHLPVASGISEADLRTHESARQQQYSLLGRYLALHSHVLLALWDGQEAEGPGGTAEVVRHHRRGTLAGLHESLVPEQPCGGPVIHLLTPRAGSDIPPQPAVWLAPIDLAGREIPFNRESPLARIEAFNRDAVALGESGRAAAEQSCRRLTTEDAAFLKPFELLVAQWHAWADVLSSHFGARAQRAHLLLFLLAGIAFALYELHHHFLAGSHHPPSWQPDGSHWIWILSSLVTLAAWAVLYLARRRQLESKHLEYRALAEALRVQFYWMAAGINETAERRFPDRVDTHWIPLTLRVLSMLGEHPGRAEPPTRRRLDQVLEAWVRDQAHWYRAKAASLSARIHWLHHKWHGILLAAALLGFAIALTFHLAAIREASHLRHHVLLGMALLLAPFALWRGFTEKRGYAVIGAEYAKMASLFARAESLLAAALARNDLPAAQTILGELGVEALHENAQWLAFYREHPMEIVAGE